MLVNAFVGKSTKPTDMELATELGPSKSRWSQLVTDLTAVSGVDVQEWKSVSKKYGWSLRLKLGQRTIVYLSPHRGCFTASLVLGDKAVKSAHASGLPASVIKMLDEAKRYAEGTGVRIKVRSPKDVAIVKKLAEIKLQN
ncbi:MAG TPA: DUF3788 domain-containing protein [Terriglobales bacterium]